MKYTVRILQIVLFSTLLLSIVSAQTAEPVVARDSEEPRIFDVNEYDSGWILGDTSGDGQYDYALMLDEQGQKKYEAVDFNNDGAMDNFYFYRNGVLHRQELDTNYDGAVDLWIFMHDGVRVRGYHRDTNHDGVTDLIREFGEA